MATEFRLPDVGENVTSGQVVKVFVSAGDTLAPSQAVLELETDKAVVEVPSPTGGTVKEVHVKEGQELKVGDLILTLEETAEKPSERVVKVESEAAPTAKEAAGEATPRTEPEPRAEPKREAPAPVAERRVETPAPAPAVERPAADGDGREKTDEIGPPREVAPAAPSVRRLARELGVDINQVPGSGPGGRISADDVKNYVRDIQRTEEVRTRPAPKDAEPAVAAEAAPPLPDFTKWGEVQREPMSSIRRTTARRLAQAWSTIPHVTHFDKADITDLEGLRKQYAPKAEAAGGKLTVTAILLKVAASALKVFPKLNASLDMANQEIIFKKYYHIGVAVDTEYGLLVPVIRNVDRKSLIELSVELTQVSEKARNRKLAPEEMEGGNFAITNLGGIGGTNFTPIINPPNVAILAVSRASMEPVYKDGAFEPRLMLPLGLSYDHRLVDGADAARFLRWLVEALEQPFLIALGS
jgi:pyruvate dehydrogenase E2 component (dihydrolipoamide acetyltransferase)